MHHVAIMKKYWGLIPKILTGEKIIESRWYRSKIVPWNKVALKDVIYFKNSSGLIELKATVSEVLQFEFKNISEIKNVIKKYGKDICLIESNPKKWGRVPRYGILIKLTNPEKVSKPFKINKSGFGNGSAWIVVKDIKKIKI